MVTAHAADTEAEQEPDPQEPSHGIVVKRADEGPEDQIRAILREVGFVRFRLPMGVWDGKQYVGVKNTSNKIEVKSERDAQQVLQALAAFFHRLEREGPVTVRAMLTPAPEEDGPKRRQTD